MSKDNCPDQPYQAIEITDFLHEINRVLPTIQAQEHRDIVIQMQRVLIVFSTSTLPMPGEEPNFPVGGAELLEHVIETLRCCGIAPAGWPQPPRFDGLIRCRALRVPGWKKTNEAGGITR